MITRFFHSFNFERLWDHLVQTSVKMWNEVAKTAYEMFVSERLNFEEAYGEFRPDFSNWAPKTSLESYVSDSIFRIMARLPGDKYLKRSQKARWDSGSWQKRFPHVTLQHGLRTMEKHQDGIPQVVWKDSIPG